MKLSDADIRPLALPAYTIAFILILIPILDTSMTLWPPRFGEVGWRFGAVGLGSQAVMTPLLGGLLAITTATLLGHRRVLRTLQILALLIGLLFAAFIAMFLLDALQMRATVKPEVVSRFDSAAMVALIKYIVGIAGMTIFVVTAQRVIKPLKAASRRDEPHLAFPVTGG